MSAPFITVDVRLVRCTTCGTVVPRRGKGPHRDSRACHDAAERNLRDHRVGAHVRDSVADLVDREESDLLHRLLTEGETP